MEQTPSIGRIVHYKRQIPGLVFECSAIINEVIDEEKGIVGLTIFNPATTVQGALDLPPVSTRENVPFNEKGELPNTWHWPERV